MRFVRGAWKRLNSGDVSQRSLKRAGVLFVVFVALVTTYLMLAPAPSSEPVADSASATEFMNSVDPTPSALPTPTSSPAPTTTPVRSVVSVALRDVKQEEMCGIGFCAAFPTAGQAPDTHMMLDDDWITVSLAIDDHKSEACQGLTDDVKAQCPGATSLEDYSVMVKPAVGKTAEAARDAAWAQRDLRVADHYQKDTVAGKPAIRSIFHTKDGGFGPYVDIYDGRHVFHVWANGQTNGARFGPDFVKSFRFTNP